MKRTRPRTAKRSVFLSPGADSLVRKFIAAGRFTSASEAVHEALLLLEERDAEKERQRSRIHQDLELGWQQSERGEVVEARTVFAEIRAMSKARRARSQRSR
jgi:antitoxin ParD1/3/4